MDRHTLVSVDTLHLFNQVHLRFARTLDFHEFLRIKRSVGDRITCTNFCSVDDLRQRACAEWQHDRVFNSSIVDNNDWNALSFVFTNSHDT